MSALTANSEQVVPGATSGSFTIDPSAAALLPVADGLWRDVYHVIALLGETEKQQLWKAFRTDTAAEVMLRVERGAKGDARADTWSRLCTVDHPNLQKACEVHYVEDYRVEVSGPLPGVTLDVWRHGRTSVEISAVETVVRHLSEALGALHSNGLAHLGMRPQVVYINEQKGVMTCTLGGLETVVRFEGDKLIPAFVNPLYAPPEAAALTLHEPGTTICGWDWWTLGRVTQELILGHHVLDEMPDADPAQTEQMRWSRAEALLFEQDPNGLRAGAVEAMTVDERLTVLLRGLLASSPEGRWGGEFVDRWLQQKSVKENYGDKRTETKFRWRGRLYTVPEAAKELQSAERWEEAAMQVFKVSSSGTLAYFIKHSPEQHLVHKMLGDLMRFGTVDPLKALPADLSRDIVLMLSLLQMAGEKLTWRGRRLNGEALRVLLSEQPASAERLAFVRVLTDRNVTMQIDKYDLEAGRSLSAVGQMATDAENLIRRFGWLKTKTEADTEVIFRLALETEAVWRAAHERLRKAFAGASDPALDKIFKTEKPSGAESVALTWIEAKGGGTGFVTHQEMKSRRLAEQEQRCQQVVRLIFWQNFERALRVGPLIFGPRGLILGTWLFLALLIAVHKPGPVGLILGLVPFALIVSLRLVVRGMQSAAIKPWSASSQPLGWDDHFKRCRDEIAQLVQQHSLPAKAAETLALFKRVKEERVELAKPEVCTPIAPASKHSPVFFLSIASWIIALAVVGGSVGLAVKKMPDLAAHQKTWQAMFASAPKEKAKAKELPAVTQITWPYKVPQETPFEITAMGVFNPSSAQSKFATDRAKEQLKGYKPDTIDSMVAIYVPLEGNRGGLLLYDGKKGAFMGRNGVQINFVPMPKMWLQIGDQRALFIEK